MQSFNIVKTTPKTESFRVDKLIGMFELQDIHRRTTFQGVLDLPQAWNVGVIVGRSGTGKSTIAKELFTITKTPEYQNRPIIDEMPQDKTVEEITKTFTEVGFSSPPSWLKPYSVLSNGEKMRADLAYHLLSNESPIVFDEFTSVVDRDVAKVCSMVVSKNVRKQQKQFVAVSCHYDILDYIEPDWVFSTDEMRMIDVKKKRNELELAIRQGSITDWQYFKNYHYMNSEINAGARIFVATLWGNLVGFIGVLHFPHPKVANMKKITRVVVLPDYQGIGVGKALMNFVGDHYTKTGFRLTITTSHPAINKSMRPPWYLMRQGRVGGIGQTGAVGLNKTVTSNRNTCSWEYKQ